MSNFFKVAVFVLSIFLVSCSNNKAPEVQQNKALEVKQDKTPEVQKHKVQKVKKTSLGLKCKPGDRNC